MGDYVTADMMTEEVFLSILNRRRSSIRLSLSTVEHYGSDLLIGENVLKRIASLNRGAGRLLHAVNVNCQRCFCVTDAVAQAAILAGQEYVLDHLSDPGSSGIVISAQDKLSARFWAAAKQRDTTGMQLAIDAGFDGFAYL